MRLCLLCELQEETLMCSGELVEVMEEVEGVSGVVCRCDVLLGAMQNAAEELEAC